MTKQYTREEIEELLKNASPFEWRVEPDPDYPDQCHGIFDLNGDIIVETDAGSYPPKIHDAKLIASSPIIIRQLLEEIKELGQKASYYKADSEYIREDWEKQNEKIKILEEGLEFYAAKINHTKGAVMADAGDKARETLEKARGGK